MTQRMRQALQAAAIFGTVLIAAVVGINAMVGVPLAASFGLRPVTSYAWAVLATFCIWWGLFTSGDRRYGTAVSAGVALGFAIWFLPGIVRNILAGSPWLHIFAIRSGSDLQAILLVFAPFVVLALIVRWLQLRAASKRKAQDPGSAPG